MNVTAAPWVTRRDVVPLPRSALLLCCALWLLPGLLGRDPWRNAEVTSFALMSAMAQGKIDWWAPTIGGLAVDTPLLPHWLGAWAIQLFGSFMEPVMSVRVAFAGLLMLTMAAVWYATFHLARTEAAQPIPMPFGGEAPAVDYARALADGALLAFVATLGLLQLGHEASSELLQLAAMSAFIWSVAAAPWRRFTARFVALISLSALAASGAPSFSVLMGLAGVVICVRSGYPGARHFVAWIVASVILALLTTSLLGAWRWRYALQPTWAELWLILRQWTWFLWPVWPLAIWTAWRWRSRWGNRHVALPMATALLALSCSVFLGGDDRTLLLATPGMAIMAAFALPTFKRQATAAIDWFSIFFFSTCALFIWFMYGAMQTGVPAKPAANVARLAPGYTPEFNVVALALGLIGSLGWCLVVRWRTSRQVHPLWKSLVLPAAGVVMCWLLLMTLWLPLLDYARSYRSVVERLRPHLDPNNTCVVVKGANTALVASLEVFSDRKPDARPGAEARPECTSWIQVVRGPSQSLPESLPGWRFQASTQRPTDREERIGVYRRLATSP